MSILSLYLAGLVLPAFAPLQAVDGTAPRGVKQLFPR